MEGGDAAPADGSPSTPGESAGFEIAGLPLFYRTLLTLISFDGLIALEIVLYNSELKVSLSFPYGRDYPHPPFDNVLSERRKAACAEGQEGGSRTLGPCEPAWLELLLFTILCKSEGATTSNKSIANYINSTPGSSF